MGKATHFFLGANSGCGFQSLFDSFCRAEEHYDLLVLKGGPGCGKSTLMRKIGEAMEKRGERVEYLHCSGDPDSLDGVNIERIGVAIVDGTAPHVIEPRYPAAVDRYVDLGRFYDVAAIKERRSEVMEHTEECSMAYRKAYRCMAAARKLEENAAELALQEMDRNKLLRRAEGVISREIRGKGNGESDRYRFLGSMTCEGAVWRFDSIEKLCPRVIHLLDRWGTSSEMLKVIHAAAQKRQYSCILCPDPEHTERLQHLLIPELELAFVTSRENMVCPIDAYRKIHLDDMIDKTHVKRWRGKLRFMRSMIRTLRDDALQHLKEAKTAHDALESVYRPHVDFAGANDLTELELRRIVAL